MLAIIKNANINNISKVSEAVAVYIKKFGGRKRITVEFNQNSCIVYSEGDKDKIDVHAEEINIDNSMLIIVQNANLTNLPKTSKAISEWLKKYGLRKRIVVRWLSPNGCLLYSKAKGGSDSMVVNVR